MPVVTTMAPPTHWRPSCRWVRCTRPARPHPSTRQATPCCEVLPVDKVGRFPLGHKPTASLWLRQPQWPPRLLFVALCALISNTFAIDVHKWPLGAVNRKCHQFRTIWSVEQGVEGFGKLEVNIKDKRFIQARRPSTDLFSLPSIVDWMRWNWVKMAKVTLIPRAKSQVWSTNHFHKLWLN